MAADDQILALALAQVRERLETVESKLDIIIGRLEAIESSLGEAYEPRNTGETNRATRGAD